MIEIFKNGLTPEEQKEFEEWKENHLLFEQCDRCLTVFSFRPTDGKWLLAYIRVVCPVCGQQCDHYIQAGL